MNTASRRLFVQTVAAASAVAATAGCATTKKERSPQSTDVPLGVQLYTLGDLPRTDLDGALRAVRQIGYQHVQLAGFLGRTPADIRSSLNRSGLICRSAHIAPQIRLGEPSLAGDIGQLAADLHVIGVQTVITPVFLIPDHIDSETRDGETRGQALGRASKMLIADDWKRNAEFLNNSGVALKREGLNIGYHNHNAEFAPLRGGHTGLSLLMANTDRSLVTFELDIGWATMAGQRPVDLFEAYPGRITHVHAKDVTKETPINFEFRQSPAEVGQGVVDWPQMLEACNLAGIQSYVVERDPPFLKSRLESIRTSHDYLKLLLKQNSAMR